MAEVISQHTPNPPSYGEVGHASQVLGPREEQLACMIAEGLSMPEIAGRLGVSEPAVRALLEQVFDTLGLSSPLELILYYYSVESRRPL
jgi:DNA-binding NarL/FixJ family response regulator